VDRVNDNASVGPVNDCGFVTRVRGSVIDVEFATGRLPPINDALAIELSHDLRLIAEVQEHLNRHNIRAVVFSQIAGVEVIYAQHGEGPFAHLERHRFLPRGTPAAEQHREKAPLLINVRPQLVFDDIVEEYFFAALENAAMQSFFSENSTRFRTMEAAYRNIQNKSDELTELLQRLRQEAVTTEILDLGAEVLSSI